MTQEEAVSAYLARRLVIRDELRKVERHTKKLHEELQAADAELAVFLGVVHTESGGDDKQPQ